MILIGVSLVLTIVAEGFMHILHRNARIMGILNAASATVVAKAIEKNTKGKVDRTVKISKDEMLRKIGEIFFAGVGENDKTIIKGIFSPWKKGMGITTTDGRYELKTFLMGWYSKFLNLRSSVIWLYDYEEKVKIA